LANILVGKLLIENSFGFTGFIPAENKKFPDGTDLTISFE
jgi:hypothetical protein